MFTPIIAIGFGSIIKVIWASFGSAILAGVGGLVVKGLQKLHIEIKQDELAHIQSVIEDAIHYVREQDAIASKTGRGFSTKAKLQIATKYVIDAGVKNLTPEQIEKLIAVVLSKLDLGATERR